MFLEDVAPPPADALTLAEDHAVRAISAALFGAETEAVFRDIVPKQARR